MKGGVGFLTSLTQRANTVILPSTKLLSSVIFSHNFDILQVKKIIRRGCEKLETELVREFNR